ncbi:MAG TPA: hypothetical protein PKM08_06195, partial [Syntrophorhabdaceae bacterium]|nr:hypothetical protein [Syntrophorhabdaceae bacterium]
SVNHVSGLFCKLCYQFVPDTILSPRGRGNGVIKVKDVSEESPLPPRERARVRGHDRSVLRSKFIEYGRILTAAPRAGERIEQLNKA